MGGCNFLVFNHLHGGMRLDCVGNGVDCMRNGVEYTINNTNPQYTSNQTAP